jgi:hypothetical protein
MKAAATTVHDASGNGNDGIIHGATWTNEGAPLSYNSSLHITAWEADPDNGLDGFTAGNPMSFKVYASVYDNMIEMNPDVTWHVGDQNFGTGQFSVVELHAISGVDPVIRLDQASLAFPPVVTGQTWVDTLYIYNDGLSELSISSASTGSGSSA